MYSRGYDESCEHTGLSNHVYDKYNSDMRWFKFISFYSTIYRLLVQQQKSNVLKLLASQSNNYLKYVSKWRMHGPKKEMEIGFKNVPHKLMLTSVVLRCKRNCLACGRSFVHFLM